MGNVGITEDRNSHGCDFEDSYCLSPYTKEKKKDIAANNNTAALGRSKLSTQSCVHLKHYGPFTYSRLVKQFLIASDLLWIRTSKRVLRHTSCPVSHTTVLRT